MLFFGFMMCCYYNFISPGHKKALQNWRALLNNYNEKNYNYPGPSGFCSAKPSGWRYRFANRYALFSRKHIFGTHQAKNSPQQKLGAIFYPGRDSNAVGIVPRLWLRYDPRYDLLLRRAIFYLYWTYLAYIVAESGMEKGDLSYTSYTLRQIDVNLV